MITLLTLFVAIALAGVVGLITKTPTVRAVPWPTPPPGPSSPPITFIPNAQIVPIAVPRRVGSITTVVHPSRPGQVPRIPPVASTIIRSAEPDPEDQIQLYIEAGTVPVTFQLMYEAMDPDAVPPVQNGWRVLRAFRLKTFSFEGKPADFEFLRPVLLRLSIGEQHLAQAGNEAGNLLMARFDEGQQTWVPLVTTVKRAQTVEVRLLQIGLLALISEPSPVPTS